MGTLSKGFSSTSDLNPVRQFTTAAVRLYISFQASNEIADSCGFEFYKSGNGFSGATFVSGDSDYPTILVVHEAGGLREVLINHFQEKNYLILEAQDVVEAFEIVVCHSRRIQLLLAENSEDGRAMAARLRPYRLDMHVIHINSELELNAVLTEVSKVLDPPPKQQKKPNR